MVTLRQCRVTRPYYSGDCSVCHFVVFKYIFLPFRNVVKSFYTAGMLFDVLSVFGDISEDVSDTFLNSDQCVM